MKRTSLLMNFIIASAVIHAGVFMVQNSINITLPSSKESVMAINLIETKQATITSEKKEKIAAENDILKTEKTKRFQPQKFTTENNITQDEDVSIEQHASSRAHVISILTEELSQHFSYPKLAKKHNWQGKVLLSLRISSKGMIKNIQIDNSSGYNILDQAAITSMRKVKSLPQISTWFKNDIELKLPVIYQLTEG